MTAATEKILFTCGDCAYKARIPGHYAGRSIHCPQCKSVQSVPAVEEPGAATGAEAAPTPSMAGGKIVFACSSCTYKGRLSSEYDGKTIRCPGCQMPQVVKGTPLPSPIVASLAADEPVFKGMEGDKVRFVCASCGYRARIPSKYAGKPIHCPQCKKVEVVKPEADLEESTGQTVSISKISAVEVKEPRLAMTNVGVQFACAVCGYESRISPSCVGDAIYCPKCRSPQKVEWNDPQPPVPQAAAEEVPEEKLAPLQPVPAPLPVAVPLPVAPLANQGEVTDLQLALTAPEAPKPAPVARASVKQGSRRVVTATPPADEPRIELVSAPPATPAAVPAQGSSQVPKRRSVAALAKAAEEEEQRAAARPSRQAPPAIAAIPARTSTSKVPLLVVAVLAVLLLVVSAVLFQQTKSLKLQVDQLEAAQVKARTDSQAEAEKAKREAQAAAQAQAEIEQQLAAAKATIDAAQQELERLKTQITVPEMPTPTPVPTPETVEGAPAPDPVAP